MSEQLDDLDSQSSRTGQDGIVVRRIRPEEYAEAGALIVAAYEPFLLGPEDTYAEELAAVERRDREAEVWVATDADDTVVGSVTVCPPGSPWGELGAEDEGEFRMLAVSPRARGRGAGRSMVVAVIDRFRADGARGIVLSSLPQMATAHRIYESLGFVRAPEQDWSPAPHVTLIAYRLELSR